MNKQIEENNSCCNSCMHRFVCFQCDDDTIVCSEYKDEREYRKSSDVAREIFEEIERLLDNHHSACHPIGAIEAYTYYEGGLGDAIADLKKKYESEGAKDES